MKTIFKYKLLPITTQGVDVPKNSVFLCVKEQDGDLYIWVLIDKVETETSVLEIEIFGTGHDMYSDARTVRVYLGTCIMENGLVWHVFNRIT